MGELGEIETAAVDRHALLVTQTIVRLFGVREIGGVPTAEAVASLYRSLAPMERLLTCHDEAFDVAWDVARMPPEGKRVAWEEKRVAYDALVAAVDAGRFVPAATISIQQLLDVIRLIQLKPAPVFACASEIDALATDVDAARARYGDLRGKMGFDKASFASTARVAAAIVGLDPDKAEAEAVALFDSHHAERMGCLRRLEGDADGAV